jgi:hypothetical protein
MAVGCAFGRCRLLWFERVWGDSFPSLGKVSAGSGVSMRPGDSAVWGKDV